VNGPPPLEVPASAAGRRVDLFVSEALGLSRARVKRLFEERAVRVDGRPARKGDLLRAGQRVEVAGGAAEEGPALVPEPLASLSVLHEDAELVFCDKLAGRPSHPLQPGETGTVANALVARYPECAAAGDDPREGGLCHRLDVGTSGVLLAARTRAAWEAMRAAFSGEGGGRDAADKRYWAVVTGPIAEEGEIDLPLRHHKDRVEPAVDGTGARPARSDFRVLARSAGAALVEVRIHTGVLHQVRAHLAAIGAPVLGDELYGGRPMPRVFLHARSLEVTHPTSRRRLRVESPLPAELRAALDELGLRAPGA
jgi:23S rRNA pseudouridine1911/1915/1917 synthase